jgi:hypothetical protein
LAIFYQTNLTDKEICKINKYIKKKITVENCHIWNGQQLKRYGIFEFRFRNHKIKLRVLRLKMYIQNGCRAIDTVQYMSNLIKIRSTHLLPIFYRCFFFGRSCSRSNNTPLTVVSGVIMNTLSQIYISQSEIESTLQNNQSENRFLRVFGVV